jgi:3-deoxy-D-manno-octulosonic-acid transferase
VNAALRALYGGAGVLARVATVVGVPGDGKLAQSVAARRDLLSRYRAFASSARDTSRPLAWFHAPSVGEGLQATPVIARLRAVRPDVQLAYTHFSPSAAAFAQKVGAEFADYLPFDIAGDMRDALTALKPSALIFSKLDVWPVLVEQATRRNVKLGMISATLSAESGRRGGMATAFTRDAYAALSAVGAIDDADAARLVSIGVREGVIRVTGDTRYDQVWQRAQRAWQAAPWMARFREVPRVTLVAGSTWPADEQPLLAAWNTLAQQYPGTLRLIIAPHEPTPAHVQPIEAWARAAGLKCARLDAPNDASADVVLVDRTGVLGELYALADVAFVGGGFHAAGLHSVLEPAAFGAEVLFGPQHTASRDAVLLLKACGAQTVATESALTHALRQALAPSGAHARAEAGARARRVVEGELGAADRALELVLLLLPATR